MNPLHSLNGKNLAPQKGQTRNVNEPTVAIKWHNTGTASTIGVWNRIIRLVTTPSVTILSTTLSVVTLIVAAVCIAAVSETFYFRTLGTFAQASLNSITSRISYSVAVGLQKRTLAMDNLVYATFQSNLMVPTAEDAELAKTGVVTPLGPSVANTTTGPFIYNLGSKIPNSSLAISTWRDFFGSYMSSIKLSQRFYNSDFDIVFSDGTYLRVDTYTSGYTNIYADLYDGILLANHTDTYFVRRTSFSNQGGRNGLSFKESSVVPSTFSDRRLEGWYNVFIATPSRELISAMVWSEIQINVTSGSAWIDLIGRVDTRVGTIGKAKLRFSFDNLGTTPPSFSEWTPLHNVKTYTISSVDNVIVGAAEFSSDPLQSLHHTTVPVGYSLSITDVSQGCVLEAQNLTCRHTVGTYGNGVLSKAWEAILRQPAALTDLSGEESLLDRTVLLDSFKPLYLSFECDGEHYYVSVALVTSTVRRSLRVRGLGWVTLSIVRQSEVTGVLSDVRGFVVAVTVGIVVLLSFLFAVSTRFVFDPIGEIAYLMTAAAYISNSGGIEILPGLSPQEIEHINKRLRDRTLSRWAEVRAIQEAYFAMSDELQELKAYIPEHLREEIVGHRNGCSGAVDKKTEASIPSTYFSAVVPFDSTGAAVMAVDVQNPQNEDRQLNEREGLSSLPLNSNIVASHVPGSQMPTRTLPLVDSSLAMRDTHVPVCTPNTSQSDGPSLKELEHDEHQSLGARQQDQDPYHPIFFADSCLIDRDITVVHLNIIGFHHYARRKHPTVISKDYDQFITYINAEVKRFGGVLESFFGDKIWVSFNATSKCVNHQIAACYFAYMVTQVANAVSDTYKVHLPVSVPRDGSKPTLPTIDKRFALCAGGGINCGVATGKAFVGPLGNSSIKRHNIISNAMTEAAALERFTLQYNGCNVFVSTEMLPSIEGFLQYVLVDVTPLPGSGGRRRAIASITGVMLADFAEPGVVDRWLKQGHNFSPSQPNVSGYAIAVERPQVITGDRPFNSEAGIEFEDVTVPTVNRYRAINECFKAYLNGNVSECEHWMKEARSSVLVIDSSSLESETEFEERQRLVPGMIKLIETISSGGVNGLTYRSTLGDLYVKRRS